jgi:hypothetical protein
MQHGWFVALLCAALLAFALPVRAEDPPEVKEGDKAPDIKLPAANIGKALPDLKDAKTISLKDFEGKKNVVLFFFPKAMTKG